MVHLTYPLLSPTPLLSVLLRVSPLFQLVQPSLSKLTRSAVHFSSGSEFFCLVALPHSILFLCVNFSSSSPPFISNYKQRQRRAHHPQDRVRTTTAFTTTTTATTALSVMKVGTFIVRVLLHAVSTTLMMRQRGRRSCCYCCRASRTAPSCPCAPLPLRP